MGVDRSNNRFPKVDERTDTYRWDFNRRDSGNSIDVVHRKGSNTVAIEFQGKKLEVPDVQSQWLAEVLLQVADFYRVTYEDGGSDDYNRSDMLERDRR